MRFKVKRHIVDQPLDMPFRYIPLTQNKNAIVDIDDYEWLMQWNWIASYDGTIDNYYVRRANIVDGKRIGLAHMHREILRCENGYLVDHLNRNTLDNRKSNLRKVTNEISCKNQGIRKDNTSGFKGISKHQDGGWIAYISVDRKRTYLGYFQDINVAIESRKRAIKLFKIEEHYCE